MCDAMEEEEEATRGTERQARLRRERQRAPRPTRIIWADYSGGVFAFASALSLWPGCVLGV